VNSRSTSWRWPRHGTSAVVDPPSVAERLVCGWQCVNRDRLRHLLIDSPLCRPTPVDANTNQLFDVYNTELRGIADGLVPVHSVRRRPWLSTLWFDDVCRAERCECRRLEHHYQRSRCPNDRRRWVDVTRRQFRTYRTKKEVYWQQQLMQCGSSSVLWRSLSSLLGCNRDVNAAAVHSPDDFANFFATKVNEIRSTTEGLPPPPVFVPASLTLASFWPCTPTEVFRIIMNSPVKSRDLRSFEIRIRIGRPDSIRKWWADLKILNRRACLVCHRTINNTHCSTTNFNRFGIATWIYIEFN